MMFTERGVVGGNNNRESSQSSPASSKSSASRPFSFPTPRILSLSEVWRSHYTHWEKAITATYEILRVFSSLKNRGTFDVVCVGGGNIEWHEGLSDPSDFQKMIAQKKKPTGKDFSLGKAMEQVFEKRVPKFYDVAGSSTSPAVTRVIVLTASKPADPALLKQELAIAFQNNNNTENGSSAANPTIDITFYHIESGDEGGDEEYKNYLTSICQQKGVERDSWWILNSVLGILRSENPRRAKANRLREQVFRNSHGKKRCNCIVILEQSAQMTQKAREKHAASPSGPRQDGLYKRRWRHPHGNNTTRGTNSIARALAQRIILRDLEAPMVLSILGKGGRDKSFFLDLLLRRIYELQYKAAQDPEFRTFYAGHVYVVDFRAWEFSGGDNNTSMLSGLLYKILRDLNEQLKFEEELSKNKFILDGEASALEVFLEFSRGNKAYLGPSRSSTEAWRSFERVKDYGDQPCPRLLKAINSSYEEDLIEIEVLQAKIRIEENHEKLKHFSRFLTCLGWFFLKRSLAKNTRQLERGRPEAVKRIEDLVENLNSFAAFDPFRVPPFVFLCFVILAILSVVVWQLDKEMDFLGGDERYDFRLEWLLIPLPAILLIICVSSAIQTFRKDTAAAAAELQTLEFNNNTRSLNELQSRLSEVRGRTRVASGGSLQKAIDEPRNALGVAHTVHEDIQRMAESMLDQRPQHNIFSRGPPRIVVVVEDLDRCEHREVAQVLETLRLLARTKLFVGIVAIDDSRSVTHALEQHYNQGGVSKKNNQDGGGPPCRGIDYLETFVQIPFRLPGMIDQHNLETYIDDQLNSGGGGEETEPPRKDNNNNKTAVAPGSPVNSTSPFDEENPQAAAEAESIPSQTIPFTSDEKTMMKDVFQLFGTIDPRCIERIVNSLKLMKVICMLDPKTFRVDENLQKALLFVMCLASDKSTRAATLRIFEWMESGTVQYHRVAPSENLARLFETELRNDERLGFLQPDDDDDDDDHDNGSSTTTEKGSLLAHIDVYLGDYQWKSLEGWSEVAHKFVLARCFSFADSYGYGAGVDTTNQRLSNNNFSPETLRLIRLAEEQSVRSRNNTKQETPKHSNSTPTSEFFTPDGNNTVSSNEINF